jgi:hypothetical protein
VDGIMQTTAPAHFDIVERSHCGYYCCCCHLAFLWAMGDLEQFSCCLMLFLLACCVLAFPLDGAAGAARGG